MTNRLSAWFRGIPSMLRRLAAIAGAVFLDAIKRKVVYAVGFFAVVLAFSAPSLPSYGVGVDVGVYREVALALTFAASLVLALALAANRIPSEVERRTVYNVVGKPVSRWEYVVGTWIGITAVMGAVIAAFTVVDQLVGLVRYGDAMWRLWEGALAIWLEIGVLTAFAVAVSAVSGAVVVAVATLTFAFAGHSRQPFLVQVPSFPAWLYPSLDAFNVINPVAHGVGYDLAYLLTMKLVFLGWVVALLVLGSLGFARRDL
jgi:ABC-type transport system involved in multi-copper enzyme maturation permease subunit